MTWPVIALVLAGGQTLTHLALSTAHSMPAHGHEVSAATLPAVAPVDGHMVLAHIGAWVVLTILFTVGERALWRSVERFVTPWPTPVLPFPGPGRCPGYPSSPS